MKTTTRRTAVLAIAVLAVGMAAAAAPTTSGAAGVTTRTVVKINGQYLTTYHWANGQTTKILDLRGGRVATQGTPTATRMAATATTAATTVYSGGINLAPDPAITAANKVASLSTPIAVTSDAAMVQALGAPADIVAQFATQDALDGTTTTATATPTITTTAAQMTASTATTTADVTGPLYAQTCFGGHFDNNLGGYYGCFNQFLMHAYSGGNWYMADHFYMSGYMHDSSFWSPDYLTGLAQGVGYGAYNVMTDWNPKETVTGGDCTNITRTVGGFGQTYSTTYVKCPHIYGLHYISQWTFHTKWDGNGGGTHDGGRTTSGVDTVHSPGSASPSRGTYLQYWYD